MRDINPDPSKRTFAGYVRDSAFSSLVSQNHDSLIRKDDGKFDDNDIAAILHDATATPAGAYRARGTPGVLRVIEIMGIEQARAWGVCSMNEFREFLGLKRSSTASIDISHLTI